MELVAWSPGAAHMLGTRGASRPGGILSPLSGMTPVSPPFLGPWPGEKAGTGVRSHQPAQHWQVGIRAAKHCRHSSGSAVTEVGRRVATRGVLLLFFRPAYEHLTHATAWNQKAPVFWSCALARPEHRSQNGTSGIGIRLLVLSICGVMLKTGHLVRFTYEFTR